MPITPSPLRYPGGKTQLYKFIKHTITLNSIENPIYCEPFSGGAGVAISLLLDNSVERIILNDYDPAIYSIWYAILNETDRFIKKIKRTKVSIHSWRRYKNVYQKFLVINTKQYSFDLGFAAFFLNRTNRAGIISGGPIGGQEQKSIYSLGCRFNKDDLISKILKIAAKKDQIELYNLDAKELIEQHLLMINPNQLFVYFDPPYYIQGQNLYQNFFDDVQHLHLSNAIKEMDNYYWIATYDNATRIEELYNDRKVSSYQLQYSANKVRKEKELFFNSSVTKVQSFDKVLFN